MKNKKITLPGALTLRQKAEALLKKQHKKANLPTTETDMLKLIHELEVHQIELELQNEELVIAKKSIEELAKEKYKEYYDFASSGYVTLSRLGDIVELNFAAAGMLGKERPKLIQNRFALFVSKETLAGFNRFVQNVFTTKVKQTCEVIIVTKSNPALTGQVLPIYVNIDGIVSQNDELCLLTLNDITERIRAKKELQESEEKYRISEFDLKKAQLISHLGNWVLNIETNELLWSDEIYRIFDCEPHDFEATYEAFLGFIHPDDREKVNSAYLNSLETKTEYQIEHRIITKNNRTKYVREKCLTTFNEQGKPLSSFGIVIDISEQKALENELIKAKEQAEESEERFNLAMKASSDGLFDWNLETNEIYYSPAWKKMLGYEDNELPNDFSVWENTTEPEAVKKSWELHQKLITKQINRFVMEFKMKHKDGHWIDVLSRAEAFFNDNGKACRMVGTQTDITERKRVEEALRKSQDRLRSAREAMLDCFLIFTAERDEQGKIIDFIFEEMNANAEKMLQMSRKQLIGKRMCEELPVNLTNGFFEKYTNVVETGIPLDEEFYLSDTHVPAAWHYHQVVRCNDGVAISHRDITERKMAEQELIAAKEHAENNNLINEARLNLLQFSENHTINEILEETLNVAEIICHSKIGFFHFVEQDQNNLSLQNWSTGTKKHYCNAQGHGLHYPIEKAGVWVDCIYTRKPVIHNNYEALKHKKGLPEGHAPLIRELVVPIIYDDEVKAIFGIGNKETEYTRIDVENISLLAYLAWEIVEKKKISEALALAKEKAEESDRLKSAFLANMSHEIRTPMNGILGFADLLKEPGLTGDEQQNYIEIIEKSGKRMLNIINQIVDISKIEAGMIKLEMQESNINKQIEYIHTFFKPEAETKGIKLSFQKTLTEKEALIQTDREKLYAILINLVKNAIKYTKEGTIEFGYNMVENLHATSQPLLQFYVKDTGIGIPKNRQEAIFERFIQADIADKMAYQGAGLGLTISKAYVEMLGGKIWVESEEGFGSTFYFTLPYNAEPVKETTDQQPDSTGSNYNFRNLKILIAEDDKVSEMLIDNYIKMFGKEILKAGTGVEAVKVCRNNPDIDLILMDIRMPDMSGYEATRQIREFNREVVIIAQTAYGLLGDREKAIKAGCNDYIAKPIKKTELLQLLQKNLQ